MLLKWLKNIKLLVKQLKQLLLRLKVARELVIVLTSQDLGRKVRAKFLQRRAPCLTQIVLN